MVAVVRAVVQRVSVASVSVDGEVVGAIGAGLLVLVGVTHDDDEARARRLAGKLWHLRVFEDAAGAMNRSLAERREAGEAVGVLVVSQFTLYGDTRKGRRPSFVGAARPAVAAPLVAVLSQALEELGAAVSTGRFRADMAVSSVNDGPVTLIVET
jgi:D-tyrosyl-tRNA(Tyr) deacylase